MASNLYEYYKEQGQALPSLSDRNDIATKAGITGYTGSSEQNTSLLGYLKNTPNQGGGNVITSDSLNPEKPINLKPNNDKSAVGITGSITSLLDTTKKSADADQVEYDKQVANLAESMKASGDTSTFDNKVIADQGVDSKKKIVNDLTSQIEQEQKSSIDQIEELKKTFTGTTGGLNAEIGRIQRESANKLANYGIALSASTRNYETASNIATRLIDSNTNKLKADVQSRQFVLQQLGTKLATEKANSFELQIKAIDKEDQYMKDAIKTATDGATAGTIDGNTAFKAVQDLTSGKISISEFYSELGITGNNAGNINGYDITTYATDPKHELKVQTIYDTLPDVTDEATATTAVKKIAPNSPITGTMIMNASSTYHVDPKLMIALMQQDSNMGTAGLGAKTKNPGNVGNDDAGNTQEYKSWDEGVDAVAKWLSTHKSTGVYKGEFASTISTAKDFVPVKTQAGFVRDLRNYMASGDYKSAYLKMVNSVSSSLTGDNKIQFDKDRSSLPAIEDLKAKLQAFSDAGGNTGLLKGKFEDIVNKLGVVADPKYKTLATDLKASLQRYRHDISGAAFSAQEASDYASVNPLGTKSLELNLSLLDGLYQNRKRSVDSTVDSKLGDGAKYIREYAESGTSPKSQQANNPSFSTPSGNSFQIISN